jgi:hypothetical protein
MTTYKYLSPEVLSGFDKYKVNTEFMNAINVS